MLSIASLTIFNLLLSSAAASPHSVLCKNVHTLADLKESSRNSAEKLSDKSSPAQYSLSSAQAWNETAAGLVSLRQQIYGNENMIHSLTSAIIANEFAWINGDPGGAKTYVSRLFFKAELNNIDLKDKQNFILQFHKLISEGVITGFPNLKSMLKDGTYEIETKKSLVADKFIFALFDEVEKANPATLMSLLSVLNERKAFLGAKVIDAALRSGAFTSNKTVAEFLESLGEDRPSGEALQDRIGIKLHALNQQLTADENFKMAELVDKLKKNKLPPVTLYLSQIHSLLDQVQMDENFIYRAVLITHQLDESLTHKADDRLASIRNREEVAPYFQANQFSNRSMRRLLNITKASFLADQLLKGIPFDQVRFKMEDKDLVYLSTGAIYGGPGEIRSKSYEIQVKIFNDIHGFNFKAKDAAVVVKAYWDPYNKKLSYEYEGIKYSTVLDLNSTVSGDQNLSDYAEVTKQIRALEKTIDPSLVEFEDDGVIARFIAPDKKTIPSRTKQELQAIAEDRQLFISVLNANLKDKINWKSLASNKTNIDLEQIQKSASELKAALKNPNLNPEQLEKLAWQASSNAYKELNLNFKELEHSIKAHFIAILSSNHIYAFGPPGGAKTSLAQTILKAELNHVQQDEVSEFSKEFMLTLKKTDPQAFALFFQQFHKLLPEGVITGFVKLNKQLDDGELEYDRQNSLGNTNFVFAILDEVEKGNPAVLTSLLSVLNEREVFIGNEVVKAALRVAVLTSNKTPSEFLDSLAEDRPAGKALLDRAIDKVYISNKFTTPEVTTQFLIDIYLNKKSTDLKSPLYLSALKSLVDKVEMPSNLKQFVSIVHEDFLGKRLQHEELTQAAHEESSNVEPDYYIAASSSSSRTYLRLLEQWKSAFIIEQLTQGVAFENIRYKMDFVDVATFAEGLLYFGPYKISPAYSQPDGLLMLKLDSAQLEQLISSPSINSRNKYVLKSIFEEAKDFVAITNAHLTDVLLRYKKDIGNSPDLFPEFFLTKEKRDDWTKDKK